MRSILTKILFSFFLLPSLSRVGFAQYQINHFTTENGLPSNGIKGLQWDASTGFLWIATEAGLSRYNGISFKLFDNKEYSDVGRGRVVFLVKNQANQIFMGSQEGNLLTVKANRLYTYLKDSSHAVYNYNYYCAVTATELLFKKCYQDPWPSLQFDVFNTTVISLNDTACISQTVNGIYYYSVSTPQPVQIMAARGTLYRAFKLGKQVYFVNYTGEFFVFDPRSGKSEKLNVVAEDGKLFHIESLNNEFFWQVGMRSPIMLHHGDAWILEKKSEKNLLVRKIGDGIPKNTLFNFLQYDEPGKNLFLASVSKGLYIIHENQLAVKRPILAGNNPINAFYSQFELSNGNILTSRGQVIGDDPSSRSYHIDSNFNNNVYKLSDSTIIYAVKDSFFIYDSKHDQRRFFFVQENSPHFGLARESDQLYFANNTGIGLVRPDHSVDFLYRFPFKATTAKNFAYDMIMLAPGKVAIASDIGMLLFDTLSKRLDTVLRATVVRTLFHAGEYLLIGTYGDGYYMMKNGILRAMPMDANNYLKYAHCFITDERGFLWISTNNGLFKCSMSDLKEVYEKSLSKVYYHYFGKESGMETTEMNGGCQPCAIRIRNRNFSFPTMDGLIWFNPEKTSVELPSGDIYIDKVLADGKQLVSSDSGVIKIGESVKKIEILLAVNAWCKGENLYLVYSLNNENWLPVELLSGEPRISLSNLGYGPHVLSIRKMNGFGIGNVSYSAISFTIATPFYHQWWFRILIAVLLFSLGYGIFKWRLRQYASREKKLTAMVTEKTMDLNLKNIQLEKNNRIKLRLISIINHDIMTPLKFMHYAGKTMVENKDIIPVEEQFETMSEITQTAKDMEQLSSQILNWIIYHDPDQHMKKEEFDLHQLVEMIFRVLQFSAKQKKTILLNEVPVNFVVYQHLEPMRVMIYNLILNSLNFTRSGTVRVRCEGFGSTLKVKIIDTGSGMTKEQIENIMSDEKIIAGVNADNKKGTGIGYLIIKDLLGIVEGSMEIRSTKNVGTEVCVSMPFTD